MFILVQESNLVLAWSPKLYDKIISVIIKMLATVLQKILVKSFKLIILNSKNLSVYKILQIIKCMHFFNF